MYYYYPINPYATRYNLNRKEENNEEKNEEKEWMIELAFMNEMRTLMNQQLMINQEILQRVNHIHQKLFELERKLHVK